MNPIKWFFERANRKEEKYLRESYARLLADPDFESPKENEVVFWRRIPVGRLKFNITFNVQNGATVNHKEMENAGWLEYIPQGNE